jgi:competence protein ComEC
MRRRVPPERIILAALLLAAVLVWAAAWRDLRPTLEVTFLDVGQGDSLLVEAPSGRNVLIDGGGRPGSVGSDVGERVVIPSLLLRGVRRLDAVVLTHPHEDHVGGLVSVVEQVPASLILYAGGDRGAPVYERFLAVARERKIPLRPARAGQSLNLGDGIRVDVLHPDATRLLGTASDDNNNAVVMRLVWREVSFLLASDVESEGEQALLARGAAAGDAPLSSTVLKVAHHGSDTSTGAEFLGAVAPKWAVISVGEGNEFGNPSPVVIRRLQEAGAKILRTDQDGQITISTDGREIHVKRFGKR